MLATIVGAQPVSVPLAQLVQPPSPTPVEHVTPATQPDITKGIRLYEDLQVHDYFLRLGPSKYLGVIGEDVHEFLMTCKESLQTLRLLETRGADFTTYWAAKQWCNAYFVTRPIESTLVSWIEFSYAFLARFVPWSLIDRLNY